MASLARAAASAARSALRPAPLAGRARSSLLPSLASPSPARILRRSAAAGLETLMPLHSAVAAARLRSCIAVDSSCWSSLSQAASATAASKLTAISSNASGISCLELDNGQKSNAAAEPTTLSLAAPPPRHDKDGLDTMLMMQQVQACREEEQHFMMTSLVQSSHQHHSNSNDGGSGNGNILSCLSVSDQQNSSCNGGSNSSSSLHFFEVDFM